MRRLRAAVGAIISIYQVSGLSREVTGTLLLITRIVRRMTNFAGPPACASCLACRQMRILNRN